MAENRTFNQIFPDSNSFTAGLPQEYLEYMQDLNGNNIVPMGILYLLLKGKYGLSRIAGSSEDSFKNRLYALIFQYGPTWARNMQIQDKLRKLTDAQLLTGSKQVNMEVGKLVAVKHFSKIEPMHLYSNMDQHGQGV